MRTSRRLVCSALVLIACGDDGGNRNNPVDAPVEPPDAPPTEAVLAIDRPTLELGTVTIGETSPPTTITITNGGETPTGAPTITVTGPFAMGATTCDVALAAGANCMVEVTFAPTVAGPASGTLTITATPGGTATLALSGEGIGTGALTISGDVSDLGTGVVEETGTTVATFTVTNTGASVTPALTVTPAGTSPGSFVASSDTCTGAALAPAATCDFEVRFRAEALGPQSALFQVAAAGIAAVEGAVSGVGTPRLEVVTVGGGAVVTPADFGSAVINNTTPRDVVIGVRSHASTPQPFGVTVPAQFSVAANPCGATIAAQATCDVTIRFAPTTLGVTTGSVVFDIGTDPWDQDAQELVGTGIEALTLVALQGANFGLVATNTTATRQFQVTNAAGSVPTGPLAVVFTGDAPLSITADACNGQTLAGGASCVIAVSFSPLAMGLVAGTLTVTGTPGGMPTLAVTGAGGMPVGTAPTAITLTPSTIAENQPANTTVGTLGAVDLDAGDSFSFTIVAGTGGADNASFAVTGSTLRARASFDAEVRTSYSIRVQVIDSGGNVFESPVAITVTNVDEPPVAVADVRTVLEDSAPTPLTVLTNDTDIDGGPRTVTTVTQPSRGTSAISGGGSDVTYVPMANTNGVDSFTYSLNGGSTALVTVTVTPVNDAPAFTAGPTVTVAEDAGAQTLAWATSISAGPANEGAQVLQFLVTADQPALFTTQPAVSPTGQLTFTAAPDVSGTATVSVRIQDDGGTANGGVDTSVVQTFSIVITPVNDPPAITSTPATTATEDTLYTYAASAVDTDGPSRVWATVAAHTCGGAIDAGTGVFTFTPAGPVPPASCVLAIRVCDGGAPTLCSAAQTTTIAITAVNDAPTITSSAPTTATEDVAYSYAAAGTDPDGPGSVTWTLAGTHTCGGTVSTTGAFTFTPAGPTPPTSCVVALRACDGASACATQTTTVTITAVNDAPTITSAAPTTATEDVAYTYNAVRSDPDGPSVAWALAPGNTCPGSSINATSGAYTFTPLGPTPPSSCVVAIRVCDGGAPALCSANQTTTVAIAAVNDAPTITSPITGTATEDMVFTFSASASDPDGTGLTWSLGVGHTCGGSVVAATGVVTFTAAGPNPPTSCVLSLRVCDSGAACGTGSGTIAITGVNDAPVITNVPPSPAIEDTLYTYSAVANDPDGPSRIWSTLAGNTCGGTINPTTGVYTFTETGPTPPTACTVAVQVCDGGTPNLCDTESRQITITPVNDAPVFTNTPPVTATEDVLYRHPSAATDPDGPVGGAFTWSLGAGHTCGGVIGTGGGVTFTIAGPVVPATCTLVIRVCDPAGACRNQTTVITITAVNDAPVITSQMPGTGNVGQPYVYQAVRSDPDGPSQTWSLTPNHTCGGSITAAGGRLTWPSPVAGPCNVSIQVCDGGSPNLCATQTQGIRII